MIVYVESNWVLNVALRQDMGSMDILELAEVGHITLCLPVISIVESYETFNRRIKDKLELARSCQMQADSFIRNIDLPQYKSLFRVLTQAVLELRQVSDVEMDLLGSRFLD